MAGENLVAAIDFGTTKIVVLVGEADADGRMYVIGHGESPSEGLRKGVVVDMEKLVAAIRKAVTDAQMVSGCEIDRLTVGISGEHIRSISSHGVVGVNRADKEITSNDVLRAIEHSRGVALPVDREIIHVIPQVFTVDDQGNIKDPVGMTGSRLEVQSHIVTASVTTAQNLYRALERCHLDVEHLVLESVALSQVLFTPAEVGSGIVLLDIGGDLTNVSVFTEGSIRHTASISLGGRNVTNDLAIGLRTPVDQAETLKLTHGAARASIVDPEEMIVVPGIAGRTPREVSRNVLATIIEPRMEEIFSLVAKELRSSGVGGVITGGIMLTGGGSLLPGTVDLAESIFDLPARLGQIHGIEHIPDELNSNRYATVHGLLAWGFTNEPSDGPRGGGFKRAMKKIEHWITRKL